ANHRHPHRTQFLAELDFTQGRSDWNPINRTSKAGMDADLPAPGQSRKLAGIVSIDIAGYSRLAEANEAAALAAVEAVRARIGRAVAAHGGRLFSSAGDGFMLEFPTATGALGAAQDIAASDGPIVRIGVHLGEVYATESGDMLGHGVNIAARI